MSELVVGVESRENPLAGRSHGSVISVSGRTLTQEERVLLDSWARSRTLPTRLVQRSRILLLLAEGQSVRLVATTLAISETTVRLWRNRFQELGPNGLLNDAPGRGRKPVLPEAARAALRQTHQDGDSMTVRQRARELGVSAATVSRWRRRKS